MTARAAHGFQGWRFAVLLAGVLALLALGSSATLAFADHVAQEQSATPAEVRAAAANETRRAKRRPTCRSRNRPRGCIKVPRGVRPPARQKDQQGPGSLTPKGDVVNGGGLGGALSVVRAGAVTWARSQLGLAKWRFLCQRFAEEAYATRGQARTALEAARRLRPRPGSASAASAGTLLYFAGDSTNRGYGHVGISLGDGRMISALDRVRVTNVTTSRYWTNLYLGWVDAPTSWPGRLPSPPGPASPLVSSAVQITAPAFGSTIGAAVELVASAAGVGGISFQAFYATDPTNVNTVGWHDLGVATAGIDGTWTFRWDTRGVPDQGNAGWGTVTVAATALDRAGRRTGTRDYRRVQINNSAPPATGTPPGSANPAPGAADVTFPETVGGFANTWSDYLTAGGTHGPAISPFQTVQVSCKVTGFKVADGNTWWYRIASSPWNNNFYVSADAFYNNGQTSGSLIGTPFVDPKVPDC